MSAVAISILLLSSSFFAASAFADTNVTAVTSVSIPNQCILPNSPATALLRVEITAATGTDTITNIQAEVENFSGISLDDISRISIYQDNDGLGDFTNADMDEIAFINPSTYGSLIRAFPINRVVPWNGVAYKWFYFIVIKTSGSISSADAFYGRLGAVNGDPGGTSDPFNGTLSNLVTARERADITITAPSTLGEKALYQQYRIHWTTTNGPDITGETINLSYDNDTDALNGDTPIVSGILADTVSDSYLWHTTGVPNGIYYIKGEIGVVGDGTWPDSTYYSLGTVDVKDYLSPDTTNTVHIITPAVDILMDGATDNILYPVPAPAITRDQALVSFNATDNIRWFDTWFIGEWDSTHDALWLDADGNGLYDGPPFGADTLLAGVAPTAPLISLGTLLTSGSLFVYWDEDASSYWNLGEAILYEGGDGNRRFYYSDPIVHITWDTTPPGGTAGVDTVLKLFLEKVGGPIDEIYSDTVYAGEPLAGSFDYDFSQLAPSQHGIYRIFLTLTDSTNDWYPDVSVYAPGEVNVSSVPNLLITSPVFDVDTWPGYPYNITYIATDPEGTASFSLYAYDAATTDTYPIVGPLTVPGTGSYLWDASLNASIPRDTYLNIRGVISDGAWTDTAQASGRIRILETSPLVQLEADSTDTVIILTWTDSTPSGTPKTYTIWRWDVTASDSPLVMIEGPGESALPEPILIDPVTNTWQYIDNYILQPGHVYYYYVVVNVTVGSTPYVFYSNWVAAMLLAFNQSPTSLEVIPGRLMAELRWDWANGNLLLEDGFTIERRARGVTNFTVIGGIVGNGVTFGTYTDYAYSDTLLRQYGDFWQYRVRALKIYGTGNVGYSRYSSPIVEVEIMPSIDVLSTGSGAVTGGGGAVGPLAVGISTLLGWWKRRRKRLSFPNA